MRHILTSVFLVVLLFPSIAFGETVKYEDLVKTDGLYYKKSSDVPFTGKTTGKIQGSFRKGKKHGPWVSYHNNGGIMSKGDYKNDKKVGPWVEYHENGQLEEKGTYKDGRPDGPWVSYWDNGQLSYKGIWKEGERVGLWVDYFKDGTVDVKYSGTYKNGKKVKQYVLMNPPPSPHSSHSSS